MSNISYGVILINKKDLKILMINRKDSLCYIDFIRGKYKINNLEYLNKLLSRMSKIELENIKNKNFQVLWKDLWNIPEDDDNYQNKKEYILSNNKFNKIKQTLNLDITGYNNSEWELPKGKKKKMNQIKKQLVEN